MGKYQLYGKYKSFNSIFLDSLPDHWEIKPLHTLCKFRQGKAHEPFVDDDGEFICVNSRFVSTGGEKVKYCTRNLTPAKLHDVLMVMSDLPNGRALAKGYIVVEERKYAVNQRVCAITAEKVDAKFLYYQLDRNPYFLSYDDGANQTHLSNAAFLKYPALLPTANEQYSIVTFLDYETIKIDRLIAMQERLIELLKEKRQAVISHAVTKGLNPEAPMKDSGVEWLGEVPAHWAIGAFKHGWEVIDCKHLTVPFVDEGVPLASIREVKSRYVNLSEAKKTTHENYVQLIEGGRKPRSGDIIYSRNVTVGEAALVANGQDFAMGQDVSLLRPNNQKSEYFSYQLESKSIKSQLDLFMVGATFKRINVADIKNLQVTFPPIEEQVKIVDYLRDVESKLEQLTNHTVRAVELLKEHSTALISAAVTGKIDVRGWQKPATEPQETATAVSA